MIEARDLLFLEQSLRFLASFLRSMGVVEESGSESQNLKLKLLEYRNRSEVPLSTRLNTDLDAEVDALRCERDALKARDSENFIEY